MSKSARMERHLDFTEPTRPLLPLVTIAAGALIVVGSLGTWAAVAPIASLNGVDVDILVGERGKVDVPALTDGLITLLLGVIVVFAGIGRVLAFPDDATPLFVVGFFAAIAGLLITGYDWWYLWDTSNVDSAFIDIDLIGWGLELAVVGSITAIIVAVVEAYR